MNNRLTITLRILWVFILCLYSQIGFSETQYCTINVGDTKNMYYPSTSDACYDFYTSNEDCIGVAPSNAYVSIKVNRYFSGTETLSYSYSYTYLDSRNKRQIGHGSVTIYISCSPTKLTLNQTELTMEVGEEKTLSYTTNPSDLDPYVKWKTSDKNVARVEYSESKEWVKSVTVSAEAEGTCVITCESYTGYTSPTCKITVIDNGWVKADVKSGQVVKGTLVTLTSTKAGAAIYYTIDGSEPTKASKRYTQPIPINEDMTLKAKGYVGSEESLILTRTYTILEHVAGDTFYYTTIEGACLQMKAYANGTKTLVQVGLGVEGYPAINKNYSGHVTIPSTIDGLSVGQIAEYAFDGCKLSSITIDGNILSHAFSNCSNLAEITIPGNTVILPNSFENCSSLRTVIFTNSVYFSSIATKKANDASNIFSNCNAIKRVYVGDTTPSSIQNNVFSSGVYDNAILYVPTASLSKYKSAAGWKQFSTIKTKDAAKETQVQLASSLSGNFSIARGTKVELRSPNAEYADIYYTLDGTTPSRYSNKYYSKISINKDCVLKAIAYDSDLEDSNILLAGCYSIKETSNSLINGYIENSALGTLYTMLVKSDGTLWGCGYNSSGQLGDGTETMPKRLIKITDNVTSVSANSHTLILKKDGTLWGCGLNYYGVLGNGTTTSCETPQEITNNVAFVSAGDNHSMIIKNDGSLWATGSNSHGQLGDKTTTDRKKFKKITTEVESVSTGYSYTMILKKDGSLWACGYNEYGQLGDGTTTDRKEPKEIMDGVTSVSVGSYHTLILKTDGTLFTCGSNSYGQLGDGTTNDSKNPQKIMEDVAYISAKGNCTYIVKKDGSLWACGSNKYGQMGDGTTDNILLPKQIMTGVASVSAGEFHVLINKKDGSLWACGRNEHRQLCDGTDQHAATPFMISNGSNSANINQVYLVPEGRHYYNLQGQKVDHTNLKGIYIKNGKKVIIK